jgi:hypothetical protein
LVVNLLFSWLLGLRLAADAMRWTQSHIPLRALPANLAGDAHTRGTQLNVLPGCLKNIKSIVNILTQKRRAQPCDLEPHVVRQDLHRGEGMPGRSNLKAEIEIARGWDVSLDEALADRVRATRGIILSPLVQDPGDFERIFGWVEQVHPQFVYLLWRTDNGRHHCSLAISEGDLDQHGWLGSGATASLAMGAALAGSLDSVLSRS